MLAAIPPWASTLDASRPSGALLRRMTGIGREGERGGQAGETAADDDASAGGVRYMSPVSHLTASMRSTARRAGAASLWIDVHFVLHRLERAPDVAAA